MSAIALAGESVTAGPDGVLVRGAQYDSFNGYGALYRFATLTLGTASDDTCTVPRLTLPYRVAVWYVRGTSVVLAGGVELDLYFQTSYDGINYHDVINSHFANGDASLPSIRVMTTIEQVEAAGDAATARIVDVAASFTDGTLADDTEVDLPLGAATRLRCVTTGAATGSLAVSCILK